jgi:small subunit ribosomal protein S2
LADNVIKEMIEAGIHFGHHVSRWNPKMQPYILTKRNSIHIIDPKETLKGLLTAKKFFSNVVGSGKDVLLVGTKRQARLAIETSAKECGMHYVNDRWLGGTLTNFRTIRSRLARLEKLEKMEADGTLGSSKKENSRLARELKKIHRNLDGIRRMDRLPGVVFVVDASREVIALREARKLGIPTVAVIDTDSDPDTVDIPIPGNDDAMRAIELICRELGEAVQLGKAGRTDKGEEEKAAGPGPRARRERVAPLTAPSPAPAAAQPAPPAEPAPAPRPPPQA